jgi:uncharacterized iron-regulated protein
MNNITKLIFLVIVIVSIIFSVIATLPKSKEIRECKNTGGKLVIYEGNKQCMPIEEYKEIKYVMRHGNL